MIVNALEWYSYVLYAYFITIIGEQFFPGIIAREFLTFAVFAAGFMIRPVGAIIFGIIGDTYGRRDAMALGIVIMAVSTAGIGLLPTYDTIGVAAPVLLLLFRLLQGCALSGGLGGCMVYLVECAPHDRKGLVGSATFVSMSVGLLLGSAVEQLAKNLLSTEALYDWGWRVAFVSSICFSLLALYVRNCLAESPVYHAAKQNSALSTSPVKDLLFGFRREVMVAIAIYVTVAASFYTVTAYMRQFMEAIGYDADIASLTVTLVLVVMMIVFPISAMLSDYVGRKPVMVSGALLLCCLTPPLIGLLDYNDTVLALTSVIAFAILTAYYMGPIPTVLAEMFPTRIRFTGVALSYNISAAIFGGAAPLIAARLRELTGNPYALTYYLSGLAAMSLLALYFYRETKNSRLSDITDAVSHE